MKNVKHLKNLTDFWAKSNRLADWSWVEELQELPRLNLVYLHFNPFSEAEDYRARAVRLLPQITRLDADLCRYETSVRAPPATF